MLYTTPTFAVNAQTYLQITDECSTDDDARQVLSALSLLDGFLGGRVARPSSGIVTIDEAIYIGCPYWLVQAFFADSKVDIDGLGNVRRIVLPLKYKSVKDFLNSLAHESSYVLHATTCKR